jgi:hypothetical protein
LQFAGLPVSSSFVQGLPSSQLSGHGIEVPGSHVSPISESITPLPQRVEQSSSTAASHAPRQQPSPSRHWVALACVGQQPAS